MHRLVKGSWSSCESERDDHELKMSTLSPECCLRDVCIEDPNLVVSTLQIYLSVKRSSIHSLQNVLYARHWKLVLDGELVQGSVIHTKTCSLVLLHDEEDGCCKWR